MLLLTHTPPDERPSAGIYRNMVPGGIIEHPRPAKNAAKLRRVKKQAVQEPATGRCFLIYWVAENHTCGNTFMWISGGKMTRSAIAESVSEIQRLNRWKKTKPVIIANFMALESEAE